MRLVLVIWAGLGVLGVVLADVAVTIVVHDRVERLVRSPDPATVLANDYQGRARASGSRESLTRSRSR